MQLLGEERSRQREQLWRSRGLSLLLLAFRMQEEPKDVAILRSWERQEPPEGMQPCRHLDFNPCQTSAFQNCKIINLCCFKPLSLT